MSKNERKVYLTIFNKYNDIIERKIYWSFDYLKERLLTKLKYLAIIKAWPNKIDGWDYFKYYKLDIYKLKNFNTFIDLIEDGTIKLNIKIDIHLNKKYYGKTYDHGCGFAIEEHNLSKLYNIIT